ncbi:hypothetical protein, partial [Pseudomonas paralactis]|uniref:hypothetical protein n=1 Tax=Pseudomonas paralactis TaxID=1615673 RepID=UPI001E5D7DF3
EEGQAINGADERIAGYELAEFQAVACLVDVDPWLAVRSISTSVADDNAAAMEGQCTSLQELF